MQTPAPIRPCLQSLTPPYLWGQGQLQSALDSDEGPDLATNELLEGPDMVGPGLGAEPHEDGGALQRMH